MINKTDINKLKRFSEGLADSDEEKYIYSLFTDNEDDSDLREHLEKEFDNYLKINPEEDHNLSYLLDRIHHIIHVKEKHKKVSVVKRIYSWYSVAAAILLIPLMIAGGIWFGSQYGDDVALTEAPVNSTLYAPKGSRISFSLPDGTQGWLNSGSSLRYELPFSDKRQIALEGEAWFNVAHDTEHPFKVEAGGSVVRVLGTKFNLKAYPDELFMEVVLEDGKVEFFTSGLLSAIEMKPNERLVFSEGAININNTDALKYSAWKEGKLVFRGDSMEEVARRIGRWYNVSVEIVDDELKSYTFRGIFQDDSLEEVVRYISKTSPIQYRILDRQQQQDGTIQKKKVLFYKK